MSDTTIYRVNTDYSVVPPQDINPLLLELYKNDKVLVVVTREGMKIRLNSLGYDNVEVVGIWEWTKFKEVPLEYDAIFVVGEERAHPLYKPLLDALVKHFNAYCNAPTHSTVQQVS